MDKGQLLLDLNKPTYEKTNQFRDAIAGAIRPVAEIRALSQDVLLEIKDIDKVATKDEVINLDLPTCLLPPPPCLEPSPFGNVFLLVVALMIRFSMIRNMRSVPNRLKLSGKAKYVYVDLNDENNNDDDEDVNILPTMTTKQQDDIY
ncbi:hypothetical protein FF38_06084 [Lucilia cuprina]|uniref:Uncharacterized protein n=1 Tax=Lucilia cuprina TaxID=7375 RepID=A0A0L0CPE7_LUCCU|nr:hypothetical protein FF38_06084 [Lucilia cuprina]